GGGGGGGGGGVARGWRGGGGGGATRGPPMANSCVESLPSTIAPAPRSFCTQTASDVASASARILEWQVVARPATSMMSLMPTGTPCSGPRGRPPIPSPPAPCAAAPPPPPPGSTSAL